MLYEDRVPAAASAAPLLESVARGTRKVSTSTLTWDEVVYVVRRLLGVEDSIAKGAGLLVLPNLTWLRVDLAVLRRAADLYQSLQMRPRDAIHAAAALEAGDPERGPRLRPGFRPPPCLASALRLLDRRPNEVAPLRPGPVVVADVRVAKQVLQHEPRVGRPLADPAVGDDLLVRRHTFRLVQGLQVLGRLEGPVLVDSLPPRPVVRAGVAPPAVRMFRRVFRRGQDLPAELLWRSHVDQDLACLPVRLSDVGQVDSEPLVRFLRPEGGLGERRDVLRHGQVPLDPLPATAVQEDDVVHSVILENPEGERREPVVEIPVEDDLVLIGEPQTPEECLEPLLRDDVPGHGIVDVLAPVDQRGTGDVAQVVVRTGIVVHLDDLDVLIPKGAFHEARVDQDFRMRVCRHAMFLGRSEVIRCYVTCGKVYSDAHFREDVSTPIGIRLGTLARSRGLPVRVYYPTRRCPSRRGARAVASRRGGGTDARPSRSFDCHWCARTFDRFVYGSLGARGRFRDRLLAALHGFPARGQSIGGLRLHLCAVRDAVVPRGHIGLFNPRLRVRLRIRGLSNPGGRDDRTARFRLVRSPRGDQRLERGRLRSAARTRLVGQGFPQPRPRPLCHGVPGESKTLPVRSDQVGRGPGASERPRGVDGSRPEPRGGFPCRPLAVCEVRPRRH